ncbi:MAG TPA: ChaN family lipoprotein [Nitrospira sp.]|nr:ChaN family lipoprotein [Nitrospira sp.]
MHVCAIRSRRYARAGWFIVACLVFAGCAAREPSAESHPRTSSGAGLDAPQIIETAANQPISLEELVGRLQEQEVIYLGEEHHNRLHIDAAISLLSGLARAGRRPTVAMEMFGWESQPLLDGYVQGDEMSRQDFVSQAGWTQNWGGPFETYEPLVAFAKTRHLRVVALNPPKPLVRLVAKKGLEQARREDEWTRWNMQDETIVDDPDYRQRLVEQLRACHGGGSDDMYRTMYEASMVRDEGMAKTIVAAVESLRGLHDPSAGPVVSYTGGGHIQYNLPVPRRVARRMPGGIRQTSIYMTSYEQGRRNDLRDMLKDKIADYVWLTPVGPGGMPRRCG